MITIHIRVERLLSSYPKKFHKHDHPDELQKHFWTVFRCCGWPLSAFASQTISISEIFRSSPVVSHSVYSPFMWLCLCVISDASVCWVGASVDGRISKIRLGTRRTRTHSDGNKYVCACERQSSIHFSLRNVAVWMWSTRRERITEPSRLVVLVGNVNILAYSHSVCEHFCHRWKHSCRCLRSCFGSCTRRTI